MACIAEAAVQVYKLDYHSESHEFFFALGDEGWSSGPWSSDARVLYCRSGNDRLAHLVAIGGTHVDWQGQSLLNAVGRSEFFEWSRHREVMLRPLGEFSVTALFEEMAEGSTSPLATLNHGSSGRSSSPYAEKH
jgi:hypothetical protein